MARETEFDSVLVWFRRDLRVDDHAALHQAVQRAKRVHCAFVFDRDILDALPDRRDRRVEFIHASVAELDAALRRAGGALRVRHATARDAIPALAAETGAQAVLANHDYEPAARDRDAAIRLALERDGRRLLTFKDQAIFERDELLTGQGRPFSVYTPYRNAWLKRLSPAELAPHEVRLDGSLADGRDVPAMPTLAALGFEPTGLRELGIVAGSTGARAAFDDFARRIGRYRDTRDYPAIRGPSYLSVHLRFGTISIRELASIAHAETLRRKNTGAETWLSELIWRDFYFQIIYHHPHAARSAFRPEYDAIRWPNEPALFAAWREARTGYPIIDAAMRQINETGYMHNRLRMIVASFLTKDLLIDWRYGEKYFADHLNDFDLSANNGGWQWAASTGCDAQPYFRIFNPVTQSERFDPKGRFIRRYLPELNNVPDKFIHAPWTLPPLEQQARGVVIGRDYPAPVVDHALQREKALALYKTVKG